MFKIPETHIDFQLSKKELDDVTVGYNNERNIICKFCKKVLIPEGLSVKVFKHVS